MMHFYRYFGKTNHNNFYFYFILHNWRKMTIFAKKNERDDVKVIVL